MVICDDSEIEVPDGEAHDLWPRYSGGGEVKSAEQEKTSDTTASLSPPPEGNDTEMKGPEVGYLN